MTLSPRSTTQSHLQEKEGFITQDDLNDVSSEVRQDTEVQKWIKEGGVIANQSEEQETDVEDGIKRLTDTISGVTNTEGRTGWKYDKIFKGVRNDVNRIYRTKLKILVNTPVKMVL